MFKLFYDTLCLQQNVYRENSALVRKPPSCLESNRGIEYFLYIFFSLSRAVCNHEAVLFLVIASPLAARAGSRTRMHTRSQIHVTLAAHVRFQRATDAHGVEM